MRIVSLLPSSTEIVCKLGFCKNLVGVSHECDYPISVKDLPILTKPRNNYKLKKKPYNILIYKAF